MNERIQKLAEQAFFDETTSQPSDKMYTFSDHKMEKFAELIVRECIAQASISNGHGNNQWDKALTFAANNIKEHFGVEE